MSELIVRDKSGVRRVPLSRLLTIGRSQNNDLVLDAIYASRRHAWVWQQGDQFIVEDLGSTHGTYLNGQRLAAPRFLNDRDLVIMGEARLTFVARPDSASDVTPPRGVARDRPHELLCPTCGAPNSPEAAYCQRCGRGLASRSESGRDWPENHVRTSRPITPSEPVVARPFPTVKPSPRSGSGPGGKAWFLIVLLLVLAMSLILVMGMLVAYILL